MLNLNDMLKDYAQRCATMQFEPLVVTFKMSAPIVVSGHLYFDGILSYAVMRDLLGEDLDNLNDNKTVALDIPLPIKKYKDVYHASVAIIQSKTEGTAKWRKRWEDRYDDLVDFGNKKKQINEKSGFFKAYDLPVQYVSADEIYFYVNGNKEEIKRLLKLISFVGKKSAQGYGIIREKSTESINEDFSILKNGVLMRPIPANYLRDPRNKTMQMNAYKPSYWNPQNFKACVMPFAENCELL